MKKYLLPLGFAVFAASTVLSQDPVRNILFIVDASGSMRAQIHGETKTIMARRVLTEFVRGITDPRVEVGLIAYGHRRARDCTDIEQLVELGPLNKDEMIARVGLARPAGESMTPLSRAIELAAEAVRGREGRTRLVLITDGKETCGADACATVTRLRREGGFELSVIGFDISNQEEARELRCIAEAGGGDYLPAATHEVLVDVIGAVTVESPLEDLSAPAHQNIEILLDRSSSMLGPFEEVTRLQAAKSALRSALGLQVADRDLLAFRHFGGACEDASNTELVVPFAQNNALRVVGAVDVLEPRGDAALFRAVLKAADDFTEAPITAALSRRVIIITGGADPCSSLDSQHQLIRQALRNRNIKPEFRFIGLGIPPDQVQLLDAIVAATGGERTYVDTQEELQRALEFWIEYVAVESNLMEIVDNTNNGITAIEKAMREIEREDYSAAEIRIQGVPELTRPVVPLLEDLTRRLGVEDLKGAIEAAGKLRALQLELLAVSGDLLRHGRSQDASEYNGSLEEYNRLVGAYNENAAKGTEHLSRLHARYSELEIFTIG